MRYSCDGASELLVALEPLLRMRLGERMEHILEVVDEGFVLARCPAQRPAGPLDGFLGASASGDHHKGLDVGQVQSLVGQRGGDHGPDVAGTELLHGFSPCLLWYLGVDEDGSLDPDRVGLAKAHSGDEDEGG